MSKIATSDTRIEEFHRALSSGLNTLVNAGKILCAMVRDNPRAFTVIQQAHPEYTTNFLENFVRVGERTLHPRLAMDASPGAQRLSALPYDVQERFVGTRVDVLVTTPDGPVERSKHISNLSKKEAEQLFDEAGNLRDIPSQRRFLRQAPRKHRPATGGGGGGGGSRTLLADEPPTPTSEHLRDQEPVSVDLGNDPKVNLSARLKRIQAELIECRSDLALILGAGRSYEQRDRFITSALTGVGVLQLALKENQL